MANLGDLAAWLFGVDELDNKRQQSQADYLNRQSQSLAGREAEDYQRQLEYVQQLEQAASGKVASAAERQLVASQDQVARQAQSQVTGATGNNATLGRYGAVLNAGDTGLGVAQAAGVERAAEAERARMGIAPVLANMGGRSASLFDVALKGGLGYQALADQINVQNQKAKAAAASTLMSTVGAAGAAMVGNPAAAVPAIAGAAPVNAYAAEQPGYAAGLYAGPSGAVAAPPAAQPPATAGADYSQGLYDPYAYRTPSNSSGMR